MLRRRLLQLAMVIPVLVAEKIRSGTRSVSVTNVEAGTDRVTTRLQPDRIRPGQVWEWEARGWWFRFLVVGWNPPHDGVRGYWYCDVFEGFPHPIGKHWVSIVSELSDQRYDQGEYCWSEFPHGTYEESYIRTCRYVGSIDEMAGK